MENICVEILLDFCLEVNFCKFSNSQRNFRFSLLRRLQMIYRYQQEVVNRIILMLNDPNFKKKSPQKYLQ